MSVVASARLSAQPSTKRIWLTSPTSATLVTPKSRIVLKRPSFASHPVHSPPLVTPLPPVNNQPPESTTVVPSTPPTPLGYAPFALCSINLITCASNSGKTQFLTRVIQQRHIFFQDSQQITRVVYLNGASFDHPWTDSSLGLEVVSLTLDDFKDPVSLVSAHDIVVIDDLLQITPNIEFLLKYGTHHFQLYLFLVTQSCLSSSLYGLLRLTHNLLLLFGNSATSRLAQHLVQSFYLCSDTKSYLKAILGIAEKQQDIVLLKLNAVASYRPHLDVLALTHLQGLLDSSWPHCYVYPELGRSENLLKNMEASDSMPLVHLPPLQGDYLEQAFVLVPVDKVRPIMSNSPSPAEESTGDDCLQQRKEHWNEMNAFLDNELKHSFPSSRWQAARNICRELMRCCELCIESNFRTVYIKKKPKLRFGIIDFLQVATRKAGPGERWSDKLSHYKPLVSILLKHDMPETFIVNKLLLELNDSNTRSSRALRHRDFDDRRYKRGPRHHSSAKRHYKDYGPYYHNDDDIDDDDY